MAGGLGPVLSGVPSAGADPFAAIEVGRAPGSLVAVGGTLDVATLLSAYRHGCFPWPSSQEDERATARALRRLVRRGGVTLLPGHDGPVPWCSPEPRAVLLADQVVVRRSLRQRLRGCGWTASVDTAFHAVVEGCADRADGTWITGRMRAGYAELHRAGHAHSIEVRDGERLVGGLYGVLVGSVFCGESMFSRERDASKVALVELCSRLLETGVRLIDVQEATAHLTSLGALLVGRDDYLSALSALRELPTQLPVDPRPVARLAPA